MGIRVFAVLVCASCLACDSKGSTPSTVEPGAAQPAVASTDPEPELEASEDDDAELEEEVEDEALEDDAPEASEPVAAAEPEGPWTFKLHNLCKRPVKYALGPMRGEIEVGDLRTIKAGAVEEIETEPEIGVHLGEGDAHSAAATEVSGGHVWISSSCKGVGASDDPNADPKEIDRKLRERIESMKKATAE